MKHDRPSEEPHRGPTRRRLAARLCAWRIAAGSSCLLALALAPNALALGVPRSRTVVAAAGVPSSVSATGSPSTPAATIAWFCNNPPAAPCPSQVQYQIINGVIYDAGIEIGRYVDNEDPTQQADVTADRAQGAGFVLAGVAQGDAGQTLAGAVSALEWYPFPFYGLTAAPPAGYASYILQAGFSWQGNRAPTTAEIQRSYCGTLALHPRLIVFYYWTPESWAAVSSAKCGAAIAPRQQRPAPPTRTATSKHGSRSARAASARRERREHRAERRRQQQRKDGAKAA